jgi:hypothetical protein
MAIEREMVEIDGFAIVCGPESVGLPATWSTDTLMERYLGLIRRVRADGAVEGVRDLDVDVIARATGLGPDVVRLRLERMTATATRC